MSTLQSTHRDPQKSRTRVAAGLVAFSALGSRGDLASRAERFPKLRNADLQRCPS